MRKAGIPVIESYNETLPMASMHRDNGAGHECTHFCHPSAPQAWVAALYRTLTQEAEKEKSAQVAGLSAAPPAASQQQQQERQQGAAAT
jgi:alpha-D-ribose 1-methylphosphonate 5-triphosphate synthase subunit PhnG